MTYSVNLTLKEMGLSQITKDQCRMFVGNGARVLIEESLKVSGDPKASRIEEGMKIYGRIFDQNCTYHVTLYEGIPEMLKALKDRGIHLAVLSNKPDRQTVKVVKEIFGDNIFDYAQGQKDGIRRKPEPDGVWYLMEQMQVSKEECLYIGDSEVDAATGKNAGLKTIGVLWGFRDRKTLETAGADHLIERPEELLQFVRDARFERMGAFAYSEGEGTYSAGHYADDVPDEVKQRRLDALMSEQEEISLEVNRAKVGHNVRVIIDREEADYYVGRTEYESPEVDPEVLIEKTKPLVIGEFYDATITSAQPFELFAVV